jgi:alpha-1,2-mannosyltransferase
MMPFWRKLPLQLRSGRWLTASRIRIYSWMLLCIAASAMAGWIALSDGLIDRNDKPLGTDFSNVYAAGSTRRWNRAAVN